MTDPKIDIEQLESVKIKTGKLIAACPACRSGGFDTAGNHLVVYEDGRFGCVANPDNTEHRKQIFELVGMMPEKKPQGWRTKRFQRSQGSTPPQPLKAPPVAKFKHTGSIREPGPIMHPRMGAPHAFWTYADTDGHPVLVVCRFQTSEGKSYRQFSFDGATWDWKGLQVNPLYRLPELLARSAAVVILVEGEKAAEAAAALLPDAVVTTWPGGAEGWSKADLTPLSGRRVILWPDADEQGKKGMLGLHGHLLSVVGAAVVKLITLPACLPLKFDAADVKSAGLGRDFVLNLIAGRYANFTWTELEAEATPPDLESAALEWWKAEGEPPPQTANELEDVMYEFWERFIRWGPSGSF
jgi:hypothetical protein